MPEGDQSDLRIYCICGQKMRVSEAMFGLPGKCVACRQKIRIPTRDEIPPGTTRINLKDHPEFLRKPKKPGEGSPSGEGAPSEKADAGLGPKGEEPPSSEAEEVDVPLGEPSEPVSTVMLDILEPLRMLCSLEHKIQRQIASLGTEEGDGATGGTRRENLEVLNGYLARVQSARAEVDEQLRQRLMEVAIDLSNTQERAVQAGLSARLGEIDFSSYCQTVDMLRRRRNHLERMQQNLRAWLTVTDPHATGGYANVSLDDIPAEGFRIALPPEVLDPRSLLDQHIDMLREALTRRERAEGRLKETERVQAEGTMPALVMADCRADIEAEKKRAEAEVSFQRRCLGDMATDSANDALTIQSCLERLQQLAYSGTIDKAHMNAMHEELMRAHHDQGRINEVVTRALVANRAAEVPYPKGTFLKRIARPVRPRLFGPERIPVGLESWIAWVSALAMGLAAFLPLVDDLSPLEAYRSLSVPGHALHWIMFGPVVAGALVAMAGALPSRRSRAVTLAFLWLVLTVTMAVLVHESQYGASAISVRFRQGGVWMLRPGILLLTLGDIGLFVAMCASLLGYKKYRSLIPVLAGTAAVLLIGIKSDMGGYFTPQPVISTSATAQIEPSGSWYDAEVSIKNAGGRRLVLANPRATAGPENSQNAFMYLFEHQTSRGEWEPAREPDRIETTPPVPATPPGNLGHSADYRSAADRRAADLRVITVSAGTSVSFHYRLGPGKYRVRLVRTADTAHPTEWPFDLDPFPVQPSADPLQNSTSSEQAPSSPQPKVAAAAAAKPEAVAKPAPPGAVEKTPIAPASPVAAQAADTAATGSAETSTGTQVELRGVITAGRKEPRFSIMIYFQDGTEQSKDVQLGDPLLDEWTISEFNPSRQTVTIVNEGRLLILNRGQRISLD